MGTIDTIKLTATLMKIVGQFMNPANDHKATVVSLVKEFATQERIGMAAEGIHAGFQALQHEQQKMYSVIFESTPDFQNETVQIWSKRPGDTEPVQEHVIVLSQITQEQLIQLINIIFDGIKRKQQQLSAGSAAGLLSAGN